MFILIFRRKDFGRRTGYAVTVFRVVMDVYIICLPLFVVSRLHMSRAKKWRVAAVFATGLLAVGSSVLSCIFRFQMDVREYAHDTLPIYIVCVVEGFGTAAPLFHKGSLFVEATLAFVVAHDQFQSTWA
ncbi:hypothetical protein BJX66DRAFT_343888 [Aspergillus keveii]|uniref:Rhodopsin domain-containing protein n=1 Tax=Aspergillus keveii TaxID=714993 RepID=A0ABR4FMU0_9EURO